MLNMVCHTTCDLPAMIKMVLVVGVAVCPTTYDVDKNVEYGVSHDV